VTKERERENTRVTNGRERYPENNRVTKERERARESKIIFVICCFGVELFTATKPGGLTF
jgi:hypothetical protein